MPLKTVVERSYPISRRFLTSLRRRTPGSSCFFSWLIRIPIPILAGSCPIFHNKNKHIEINHYIRKNRRMEKHRLEFCPSENQLTNILTKP
ncbi:hypothetical protein KSP40_PGU017772 [Platanthera guangdongensis]|uniref:Uncharacterized protein n=1 Tax=Platanthera guangdongensis TaxID=2320717 RepID=A0ABR2MHZ2_9ASPA